MEGRVALVAGGSRGIGRAIAEGLARKGARIVVLSRRPETAAAELRAQGYDAIAIAMDLAREDPEPAVEEVLAHYGRLDILVYASGTNIRKPALEMTYEEWREVLRLNLDAAFLLARAAAVPMRAQKWGRIVFVGSTQSFRGGFILPMTAYCASKAGLLGLTRGLAKEWAPDGICVNLLAPGFTRTDLTVPVRSDPEVYQWTLKAIPLGRWAEPEEIASAAVFLCSEEAGYITGQSIVVDGGFISR